MNATPEEHRDLLARVARDAMIEYGTSATTTPAASTDFAVIS